MSTVNPLAADLQHVLEHTRPLWVQLRGERVFITGGSGFFGRWLLDSFLFANDALKLGSRAGVLSRDPDAFRRTSPQRADDPAITLVPGDARSFAFPAGEFSHVVHAATETAAGPIQPTQLFRANIDATTHVLEFLERCHARKLVFTSSGAVYGKQPSDLPHVPEDYA